MNYSFYATEETLCKFECIKEYITEYHKIKGLTVAKISFNDGNYKDFIKALNEKIQRKI